MVFAHDTEVALAAAAALVNTAPSATDEEELAGVEDLDRFVTGWGWTLLATGDPDHPSEAVLAQRPTE